MKKLNEPVHFGEGNVSFTDLNNELILIRGKIDEIVDWISTTSKGRKYIQIMQNIWTNRNIIDPSTGLPVRGSATFIDKAGKINLTEVREYIETVTFGRLAQSTGNDPRLLEVIATGS